MTYQIGVARYVNLGPFKDVTFDFSYPGLTCIEGRIEGKTGCDSNGSGKSFLYEGPNWVLFDRCIRSGYGGDDIIRGVWDERKKRNVREPGVWAMGEVNIIGGPESIRVERYRKHPVHGNRVYLYVGDKDVSRGTNAETNRAIEQIIGMDYTTYCNSVAFGVRDDIKSFFSAPDAERKRIMDNLFGLELYEEAEKVARRRVRAFADELGELSDEQIRLQASWDEKILLLRSLQTDKAGNDTEDTEFQIKVDGAHLKSLRAALEKINKAITSLRHERTLEEKRYEIVLAEYETEQRAYESLSSELDREERSLDGDIREAEGEERQVKTRQERWENLGGAVCPTCEQTLDPKVAEAKMAELEAELSKIRHTITASDLQKGLIEKRKEVELTEPEQPTNPEIEVLDQELQQEKDRLSELEVTVAEVSARLGEAEKAQARLDVQIKVAEEAIEKCKEARDENTAKWKKVRSQVELLDFWVEGYGANGLRSFLIEAELPEINRWATVHAQKLLGAGTYVRLDPTTKLKSKKDVRREKISIACVIPGCTNSHNGASRGQKTRLDLSLLLSFRSTVSSRSVRAFNQLFADELFDGMDKTGTACIADLLWSIADGCPVTLVTHDPRIKLLANRVVTVYHNGTYAKLIDGSADPRKIKVPSKKSPRKKKSAARA